MAVPLTPTICKLNSLPSNRNRRPQARSLHYEPKLTKALAIRFCNLIAETDKSLFTLIEQNPGLPHHKTLFNWQQRVPWFADMWKQARIRQTHYIVEKCLDLAKNAEPKTAHVVRVQFDIYKWFAAKFNPDTYGDKPAFAPQQTTVNVGISISPERLTEIRGKLDQTRLSLVPKSQNGDSNHASKPESVSRTYIANGSKSVNVNGDRKALPGPAAQPAP